MRTHTRRAAALALAAGVLLTPSATLQAQGLATWASCTPTSACGTFRFSFAPDAGIPLSLTSLELTFMSPGWSFMDDAYTGADAFSPTGFGPYLATLGGAGTRASFDFGADLGWFEVADGFVSFLDVGASGSGSGSYAWDATDFAGDRLTGTGTITGPSTPSTVTPEPAGLLLVATGLVGVVLVRSRRGQLTRDEA